MCRPEREKLNNTRQMFMCRGRNWQTYLQSVVVRNIARLRQAPFTCRVCERHDSIAGEYFLYILKKIDIALVGGTAVLNAVSPNIAVLLTLHINIFYLKTRYLKGHQHNTLTYFHIALQTSRSIIIITQHFIIMP